jgi:hypothetical protein
MTSDIRNTTTGAQRAEIAASINPPGLKPMPHASTRSSTTAGAENPSSQPTGVAALADFVGGPSGGFIVGAIPAKLQGDHADRATERARHANDQAEQRPAQTSDVLPHAVADLNGDGFITLDEITAMHRAGLDEPQMLERLRQAQAVFSATTRQQQYLLDRGVPAGVVKFIAGPGPTTR